MINKIMKSLIVLLSFFSTVNYAGETAITSVDRAWGLLLGDEITATVTLPEQHGKLDINSLPQTEKRVGTWLFLKDLQQKDNSLLFKYQVVNVPKENTLIDTPIYEISDEQGNIITIQSAKMSIGPLLSAEESKKLTLKPDHKPIFLATDKFEQQQKNAVMVAIIVSLILLAWHFGWKPKNRQPFAQAVHELSRLRWQRSKDVNQPSRILHTAFNQTAGTVLVHKELANVFETAPWLSSLEIEIDHFYQQSAGHFFAREAGQEPDLAEVMKLAKACRSKEKLA